MTGGFEAFPYITEGNTQAAAQGNSWQDGVNALVMLWKQAIQPMHEPRLYNLPPTAPMGGGTLLFEGAHLIDAIRPFVAKQENVVITPLFFGKPNH